MSLPHTRHAPSDSRSTPAPGPAAGRRSDHVIVGHWLASGGSLFIHAPGEPCRLCQRAASAAR